MVVFIIILVKIFFIKICSGVFLSLLLIVVNKKWLVGKLWKMDVREIKYLVRILFNKL